MDLGLVSSGAAEAFVETTQCILLNNLNNKSNKKKKLFRVFSAETYRGFGQFQYRNLSFSIISLPNMYYDVPVNNVYCIQLKSISRATTFV